MDLNKIAINGRYTVRKLTGQERFARELLAELDKIVPKDELVVVVPEYAKDENIPDYQNIKVVRYGNVKSHFWEQISFYRWLRENHRISVNLTSTCPWLAPGIVCMHDAAIFDVPKLFMQNTYGVLGTIWKRFLGKAAAHRGKHILTVSEYSKNKLHEILGIPLDKISVVYNAWQHFNRVVADDNIFQELSFDARKGEYFMALSSLSPQKNFIWIKEVAKRNPNKQFVIVGKAEGFTKLGEKELAVPNLQFTGYLTDGQIKSLMTYCRAFIHPAIYEGFGIPPLEAMSCGAELIISTATCLPEIYGKSVHYIDPYNYDVDLDKLLQEPIEPASKVLSKFSWEREAKKLLGILEAL